ncbi:amidohydrolase [Brevibacterium samyangense]|uniref:Amidohydrolase n=1 Tax=Brevibacterium samyangense TaxID=366888 RepID=A0ABP5EPI9_9MICO
MSSRPASSQLFTHARVFTGEGFSDPTSLFVAGGRIVALGPEAEAAAAAHAGSGITSLAPETVDLAGGYLMPGFVESHGHPTMYGGSLIDVDVRPSAVQSITEIQKQVSIALEDAEPGQWIRARGWDETYILEGRVPTRDDLDEVAPDNPVVLERTCGHMRVVNSAALTASGVDESVEDPAGGRFARDGNGRLTGLVQEDAMKSIAVPKHTDEELARGFALAQEDFAAWGVTCVNDLWTSAQSVRLYTRLAQEGALRLRVRPWLGAIDMSGMTGLLYSAVGAGITSGYGNDLVRIQGVKFVLDGAMGGRTAAVTCPFEGTDNHGILLQADTEALAAHFRVAADGGLRLAIHGIGDAAIEQALEALERIDREDWIKENRIRIEHCSLPTDSQLDRMVEWNLVASSSVGFVYHLGDSYINVLGEERVKRVFPHRTFIDRGIVAPGNSDIPVTNGNPWEGIYGLVTRTTRTGRVMDTEQNVTLAEAIAAYTRDGAYGTFEENDFGTLEVGKFADMQVYTENPFDLAPEQWLELAPQRVFLGGSQVWSAP